MTTRGRQFTLHLQFAARAGALPRDYEEFLMTIPGLLKGLAYKIVDFEVLSYERTAQTNMRLNVIVFPPELDETIVTEAKRLGLRDPVQTAASTAMMLWLKDLRTPFATNPLHSAWRTWCGLVGRDDGGELAPLYLHCYGITPQELAPEAELVSPRSEASDPQTAPDPVNLTDRRWLPRGWYDGST